MLKDQVDELLTGLRNGGRVDRALLIMTLSKVSANLSEEIPPVVNPPKENGSGKFNPKENTPVRFPAKNWGQFAPCKRCGKHEIPDGDMMVRIKGTGWFHDYCYYCVNPDFYEGLEPPKPPKDETTR